MNCLKRIFLVNLFSLSCKFRKPRSHKCAFNHFKYCNWKQNKKYWKAIDLKHFNFIIEPLKNITMNQ